MTPEATLSKWEEYSTAWTALSSAEREALLRTALAEDVVYTSPVSDGRGIGGLATVIEDFQSQFPGAYFQTSQFLEQHNQSLAEWTMRDQAGASLLMGRSYARFNDEGLIEHLAGFW